MAADGNRAKRSGNRQLATTGFTLLGTLMSCITLLPDLRKQAPDKHLIAFAQPQFQVSKAAADLLAYCDAHIREDPLIVPVPASENPFREKKFFCTIL
ncbi:unnamed protein product [Menidia menidia]|uniref:Guanine nucleotide-binding protein subunit gamma n=1 Tax=Menidia menidia TaxID=238744 RepID=A0A8S4BRE9_9TELE|nr:unnamed protein product [Menidia menidia]